VSREVRVWRERALQIPDEAIRQDALRSIAHKRGHTDGAALFWILPRRRHHDLLRLLVTYELIWDFLDCLNERGASEGTANGRQLHQALIEALDPAAAISDYYRFHPWQDDGGYLRSLVESCRRSCAALPCYGRVRPLVLREARRAQVLALNHDLDPGGRDASLRAWAHVRSLFSLDVRRHDDARQLRRPSRRHRQRRSSLHRPLRDRAARGRACA
jgi:tetraprenyl-beta-curcumene synthase